MRAGRVTVNGKPASLGDSADPRRDRIALDGEPIRKERASYWMLHKPLGVLTTMSDPEGRPTVVDLLPDRARRLFPVGRLDRETEGLVLMTNDGAVAHVLLHPSHGNEREYRVTARGEISRESLDRLAKGVALEDGMTAPARVGSVRRDAERAHTTFSLTLREGRKRQIRRAMSALGHPVMRLVRIRMGPIRLGRLASGEARPLRGEERTALAKLLDSHPAESRVQRTREVYARAAQSGTTP